jgi:stress-induced morphogen
VDGVADFIGERVDVSPIHDGLLMRRSRYIISAIVGCGAAGRLRDISAGGIAATPVEVRQLMITQDELAGLIRAALPDATVEAFDWTGTLDHYNVRVTSSSFTDVPLIDQHRLIYAAVDAALKDGRLHAIQIKTETRR